MWLLWVYLMGVVALLYGAIMAEGEPMRLRYVFLWPYYLIRGVIKYW